MPLIPLLFDGPLYSRRVSVLLNHVQVFFLAIENLRSFDRKMCPIVYDYGFPSFLGLGSTHLIHVDPATHTLSQRSYIYLHPS